MKTKFLLSFCLLVKSDLTLLEAVKNEDFGLAVQLVKSADKAKLSEMVNFQDSLGDRLRVESFFRVTVGSKGKVDTWS